MSEPFEPPYASRFNDKLKKLSYIAAKHESNNSNETFRTIENEFKHTNPEIVLIEGIPSSEGVSPNWLYDQIKRAPVDKIINERDFSVFQAIQHNIDFIGCEPSDKQIKNLFDTSKFSLKDLIGYYLLQEIPVWKRQGKINKFIKLFNEKAKKLFFIYGSDQGDSMNLEQFKRWYSQKNNKEFDLAKITSQDTAPIGGDHSLYTQMMSIHLELIRDRHILGVIAHNLNKYRRIFVVYGAGHLVTQRNAIENMLGKETSNYKFE